MRTTALMAAAAAFLLVAATAAFGRWGLAAASLMVCVGCVAAAAVAAGVERGA